MLVFQRTNFAIFRKWRLHFHLSYFRILGKRLPCFFASTAPCHDPRTKKKLLSTVIKYGKKLRQCPIHFLLRRSSSTFLVLGIAHAQLWESIVLSSSAGQFAVDYEKLKGRFLVHATKSTLYGLFIPTS